MDGELDALLTRLATTGRSASRFADPLLVEGSTPQSVEIQRRDGLVAFFESEAIGQHAATPPLLGCLTQFG